MYRNIELSGAGASRADESSTEEDRFPFEARPFDTDLFKSVQKILAITALHDDDLTTERMAWPELDGITRASTFHKAIVNSILKKNLYVMWIWDFAALFHNLSFSSHHEYQLENQKLNMAIKKIYLIEPEQPIAPIAPIIQHAIDQLLLLHIERMYKSDLFNKQNIADVVIEYGPSIHNIPIRHVEGNWFRLEIDKKYREIINADTELVFEDNKRKSAQLVKKDEIITKQNKMIAKQNSEIIELKEGRAKDKACFELGMAHIKDTKEIAKRLIANQSNKDYSVDTKMSSGTNSQSLFGPGFK